MLKLDSSKENIFFSSDLHLYHKNITRGVTNWTDKTSVRDFDNQYIMTNHIISQINKYVGENDILILAGDFAFGGFMNIPLGRQRINCKRVYTIAGNHDMHIILNKQIFYGIDESFGLQSLFNYMGHSALIEIDKVLIYLSHFPSYDVRFDKKSIHLHGHTHGVLPMTKDKLDVGIDNAFNIFGEYRPFTWQEIKQHFDL